RFDEGRGGGGVCVAERGQEVRAAGAARRARGALSGDRGARAVGVCVGASDHLRGAGDYGGGGGGDCSWRAGGVGGRGRGVGGGGGVWGDVGVVDRDDAGEDEAAAEVAPGAVAAASAGWRLPMRATNVGGGPPTAPPSYRLGAEIVACRPPAISRRAACECAR